MWFEVETWWRIPILKNSPGKNICPHQLPRMILGFGFIAMIFSNNCILPPARRQHRQVVRCMLANILGMTDRNESRRATNYLRPFV